MPDYQFTRHREFSQSYVGLADRIRCPEFKSIAETFSANVNRVKSLGSMPVTINYWSSIISQIGIQSKYETGTDNLDYDTEDALALGERKFAAFLEGVKSLPPGKFEEHVLSIGGYNVESFTRNDLTGELPRGIEAVLASMIMGAWAAFETLSIDLWIAAVNKFPRPLAQNFSKRNGDKGLNLSILSEYEFDISGKMGTILRHKGKAKFDGLNDIKEAYQNTFGENIKNIFENHPKLFESNSIRNLLAHRAGNIDSAFVDRMKSRPGFSDINPGQMIQLTGGMAAVNIDICIGASVDLLMFVDDWACGEQLQKE